MSGQNMPGPSIAQMRARMNSGHRQVLEAVRDGRKLAANRVGDARGLMTCRATLVGWGAIEGESLTDTGRALLTEAAPLELVKGRTYRAKRPARAGTIFEPLANDRTLVYVGIAEVQYDGPSVALGRHYPKISIEAFQKWAARDVTDELPDGEYAPWPLAKAVEGAQS